MGQDSFKKLIAAGKAFLIERSLVWRVTAILMTGLLILSAIVQWNDPDPLALDTLLLRHRNHYPLLTDPPTTTIHPANLGAGCLAE